MVDYEAWRPALLAFYQAESPWMAQTIESLRKGWPLTEDNRRVIRALMAVREAA
jgi:hypothetical protein